MIVVGQINNVSEKLKKKYCSILKPNTTKEVELLAKPDPENPGLKLMPGVDSIRTRDVIFDPEAGEYVEVAYVAGVESNGTAKVGTIVFEKRNNGIIKLKGGNADDQHMWDFLCLTDQNESKEGRNKEVTPRFRVVDREADAKAANDLIALQTQARNVVSALRKEDLDLIANARGWFAGSPEVTRSALYKMAEASPKEVMSMTATSTPEESSTKLIEYSQMLLDKKHVRWDKEDFQLKFMYDREQKIEIDLVSAKMNDKKALILADFLGDEKNEAVFDKIKEIAGE